MPAWRNILRKHGNDKPRIAICPSLGQMIVDSGLVVLLSRSARRENGIPFYWVVGYKPSTALSYHIYGSQRNMSGLGDYDSRLADYSEVPPAAMDLWPDAQEAFEIAAAAAREVAD